MQKPSQRPSRSKVAISIGPFTFRVNVWSASYTPPSPRRYCQGTDGATHEPTPISSKSYCSHCSGDSTTLTSGEVVSMFADEQGALVPIPESAKDQRVVDVAPLRDRLAPIRITRKALGSNFLSTNKIYWLTPTEADDEAGYAGLVRLLERAPLVLVAPWASRSVAKPYLIGASSGMLTLTELVSLENTREAPAEPPAIDADDAETVAAALLKAIGPAVSDQAKVEQLAIDPGREALAEAARRAVENGAETIKPKRTGTRETHKDKLAEADLAILLSNDLFE